MFADKKLIPDEWKCAFCEFTNRLPTKQATNDGGSEIITKDECNSCNSCDVCNNCKLHYQFTKKEFGTPSHVWKKERDMYKSNIIHDLPAPIPQAVAHNLQSDTERFLYKQTKRTLQMCLDKNLPIDANKEYTAQLMMRDLDTIRTTKKTRAVRKHNNMLYLDRFMRDAWFRDKEHMYDNLSYLPISACMGDICTEVHEHEQERKTKMDMTNI